MAKLQHLAEAAQVAELMCFPAAGRRQREDK